MKTKSSVLFLFVLTVIMATAVCFTACDFGGSGSSDNQQTEPVLYTIQYTDDVGTHQIQVQSGQPYSIENIPSRTGYDFMGLFDAETGGTQYVNGQGASVAPFTDNKNLVLFPQFKAKEYKVILNYGDAPVTSVREISVEYDSELPELPVNLTAENKDFKGWYTEPNCGGTQIADTYGVLPDRRLVTEQNFDLSNANGYIYLYAGFTGTMRTITFYVGDGNAPIVMQVEHGTLISDVVPDYRDEDGYAVLEWTQESNPTDNSAVFKGEVTRDMTLYTKTFAPVIEFDANGGEDVTPLVQTAGRNITLPTPVRANYKFLYWTDASGEKVAYSTMPSESVELTAVWQAMLVFDENGGIDVNDISQAANTSVTLPTPEREGYIFAGWYTTSGEKYESTRMPAVSEVLKAGWYRVETVEIVVKPFSNSQSDWASGRTTSTNGPKTDWRTTIDLSEYLDSDGGVINITLHYKMKLYSSANTARAGFYLYDNAVISDVNLLFHQIDAVEKTTFSDYQFNTELTLRSDVIYLCYYVQRASGSGYTYCYWTDIWAEIEYPDTSVMY